MKKRVWLIVCMLLVALCAAALADVEINEKNFPDGTFRDFVNQNYGTKGILTDDTIKKTTSMDCSGQEIGSLEGIQNFASLTSLNCGDNNLTDLSPLTKLKSLTELNCSQNYNLEDSGFTSGLPNLVKFTCVNTAMQDIAGITVMTKLQELHCQYSRIYGLDFSKCTELTTLECQYNEMGDIDLSQCAKLAYLDCQWSGVTSLNVKNLASLKEIHCNNNGMSSVDFSGCKALTTFNATFNQSMNSMNLSGCVSLASFSYDESSYGCMLNSIDVSGCTGLKELYCSSGQLMNLNVNGCTSLEKLNCQYSHLDNGLDVTGCPALKELDIHWTCIGSEDVSKCPKLEKLSIYGTYVKSVDVSACPALVAAVQKYKRQSTSDYDYYGEADNPVILLDSDQTITGAGEGLGRISLNKAVVSEIRDQVYTGKAITPKLTVTLNGKQLTKDTDFTLSFKNNKQIGQATVTVTGIGRYDGAVNASFSIIPKKVTLTSLKAGKKSLTVNWKKADGIDGYEIEYSLKKSFKGAKSVTVKSAKTATCELTKLKSRKKYYIRIRSFKKVKGKKYHSEWSKVLSKKVQ